MKKCLVGVVSWCDSTRFPERFKIFRKVLNSIEKYVPRDISILAIVDNNSSDDVRSYIEVSSLFDVKVLLPENTHDVGAYGVLAQIAKDKQLPYLWLLENDYVLYRKNVLEDAINFLKNHKECGYVRMQKFEFNNKQKYDKSIQNDKNRDRENSVWLKNIEDGKPLNWSKPLKQGNSNFFINNWHFGIHGGVIATSLWEKIYPKLTNKVPYYYKLESSMRSKYHRLKLKTAVLDGGTFSMSSPSVYKRALAVPFFEKIKESLEGTKGGYINGKAVLFYRKNYSRYGPVQIQLFSNSLGNDELKLLREVFESKWLGYGAKSKQFENEFSKLIGSKYALGISSCTAGLFMTTEMIGLQKGDEVIIPSVGFIACANSVLKARSRPVFADVDPRYLNILPREVERLVNKRTKAIMVLHYGGIPSDISTIKKIIKKQQHKIYLIEDSANSIKSLYKDKYCGNLGDIGLFSLDVNKVITTGTGGMLTTNDENLYYKARVMRFYGLKPELASGYDALKARKERWWEIDLEYPGNRYITNDITSAIGLEQLKKLDLFIQKRKRIWNKYNQELKSVRNIVLPPEPPPYTQSSYYFYWIQVYKEEQQLSLANYLVKNGIYTTFRYFPLHMIKFYGSEQKLPNSEKIARTTLNLPFHHNLSEKDTDRVIKTIKMWDRHYS